MEQKYTVICNIGAPVPRSALAGSGLNKADTGELLLRIESGAEIQFKDEEIIGILVRDEAGGPYLPTDEFFEHRY